MPYDSIPPLIKQCNTGTHPERMLAGSSAGSFNNNKNRFSKGVKGGSDIAMRFPCRVCAKFGHWAKSHNDDRSLHGNVNSVNKDH